MEHLLYQQQKNIMDLFGQLEEVCQQQRDSASRSRNTNGRFSYWWGYSGPPGAITGATEEYNGSSWTSNPTSLNTARATLAGCGTQTAGLAFGGYVIHLSYRSNRGI
jgi:hypothetical protein